jgi:hypothetical protein
MSVPVVMGERGWVHAGNLDAVADLLGIEPTGHRALPPAELIEKYDVVLAAAQRYLRVFPPEQIRATVPRRDQRDMRQLGYHVFAIADDLMTVKDGDVYLQGNAPVPDGVRDFDDIVAYGDAVRKRLRDWYAAQPNDAWRMLRTTSFGALPLHLYLERATWHSAQHSRQIVEMLRYAGVQAPDVLPESYFDGLPMPNGVWD